MRMGAVGLCCAVATSMLTLGPGPARGQALGISEYRRLIDERERDIARLSARLSTLETQADSLGRVKRGTRPGSAQYEAVSNRILVSSREITEVARQLRVLYEQVRDLKTALFLAYNAAIAETQQAIDDLTRRGRTTGSSLELRRQVDRLEDLVMARERLTGEIEEAQEDLYLPQLALDPADGPQRLRAKEAIARDAIDRIDERIAAIEDQMTKALQRKRDLEEFRRLQDDIELWGDAQATQGGSEIEAILQSRVGGGAGGALFDDPDVRIRELQRRRVELFDRRADYESKARLFAQRQREFYP